jgi:AcrR family transcriptional regulator
MGDKPTPAVDRDGAGDPTVRERFLRSAEKHLCLYGYAKTTISELASEAGFSKAYVYKFFPSKQAIAEAICGGRLDAIMSGAELATHHANSAPIRLRTLYRFIAAALLSMWNKEQRMFELLSLATTEKWHCGIAFHSRLRLAIHEIIRNGRDAGEFERETPLDETSDAVARTMTAVIHPFVIKERLDGVFGDLSDVIGLVLRSLAP